MATVRSPQTRVFIPRTAVLPCPLQDVELSTFRSSIANRGVLPGPLQGAAASSSTGTRFCLPRKVLPCPFQDMEPSASCSSIGNRCVAAQSTTTIHGILQHFQLPVSRRNFTNCSRYAFGMPVQIFKYYASIWMQTPFDCRKVAPPSAAESITASK